jgi:2-iminobutanoate/2-iminopropanoate deaminase
MKREVINPENLNPALGFSHAIKVGNTIYTSGKVSEDEKGNMVGEGNFAVQVEKTMDNLKKTLEAAGATLADVVQINMFVSDIKLLDDEKMAEYWVNLWAPLGFFPPSTGVEAKMMHGYMFEVSAIAVIG